MSCYNLKILNNQIVYIIPFPHHKPHIYILPQSQAHALTKHIHIHTYISKYDNGSYALQLSLCTRTQKRHKFVTISWISLFSKDILAMCVVQYIVYIQQAFSGKQVTSIRIFRLNVLIIFGCIMRCSICVIVLRIQNHNDMSHTIDVNIAKWLLEIIS